MAITRAKTSSVAQGPSTKKTLLGGNDVILGGSYDAIGVVDVGSGGQSTITFSSIPSTYKHLQIRAIARSTSSVAGSTVSYGASGFLTFNGDTAANYAAHYIEGNGSTPFANAIPSYNYVLISDLGGPYSSSTAGTFSASVIDILDYANTSKNKTLRVLNGQDRNGYGRTMFQSGLWRSTSAISSVSITISDSANFSQYSHFALYGIK
jgi:hypothetical protein